MENNEQGVQTPTQDTPIDFESEYKKMLAERDTFKAEVEKQKKLKDQYATENAEYKKKEISRMSDEEKKVKEYQELIQSNEKLQTQLKEMQLEKDILGAGFTNDECKKLMDSKMSVQSFAEILKERLEANEKSIRASLIKDTTPSQPMGNGTTNGSKGKTDFQLFQEKKAKETANGKVEF